MIILFYLKLDKCYYIGAMNQLIVICFFVHIKMSYYWFNRQQLLQKAKDRYHQCGGKEKAAKYYPENKGILKEKAKSEYKDLSEKEKEEMWTKQIQKHERKQATPKKIKNKILFFCIVSK